MRRNRFHRLGRMFRRGIVQGCAVVGVCLVSALAANGDKPTDFDALKARYLSLRNTDVTVVREGEWRAVAIEFERFALAAPAHRAAPQALLNAAIVRRELAVKRGVSAELERALEVLTTLVERYPTDGLADDALVKRGEIELNERGDADAARAAWQAVIDRYPAADMRGVAAARLAELRGEAGDDSGRAVVTPAPQAAAVSADTPIVVLDPGHGGEDTGAEGRGGLLEKDVTLAVARELKKLLEGELGAVVYLTRTDDSFRPLLERTAFANERRADIFVSLHANASPDPRINGVESYYLDTSDGESARKLAERENASVRFEGPAADVAYMLSDLVQSAKTAESVGLARAVQHALVARLREGWPDVRDLGVKKALFYVLVGAHMPCVLVEIGFMNHPVEGPRIASERYRTAVARGIFDGLKAYLVAGEKR